MYMFCVAPSLSKVLPFKAPNDKQWFSIKLLWNDVLWNIRMAESTEMMFFALKTSLNDHTDARCMIWRCSVCITTPLMLQIFLLFYCFTDLPRWKIIFLYLQVGRKYNSHQINIKVFKVTVLIYLIIRLCARLIVKII